MRRAIGLLLAFILILGLIPLPALAATKVVITRQPKSVAVAIGEKVQVKVTAAGDGLRYTWYFRNPGSGKFHKTDTFKGDTYTISAMDAKRSGRQIYCVVTDKYGNSVRSDTVTLSVSTVNALKITRQPVSVSVLPGTAAKVCVAATGDGLSYTWYFKNPGAGKFHKTDTFKGNTYTISSMDAKRSGRQIYCVVTDKYGNSVRSDTVTLSVSTVNALKITRQPLSVSVLPGTAARVSLTATGDGLSYTWYFKNPGAGKFHKTDTFKGNTYTISAMDAKRSGRQVYCVVTDRYGNSVRSDTVTLTAAPVDGVRIIRQPVSVRVPEGTAAKVSLTAAGDGLSYTWYYKNPGGSKFYKTDTFKGNAYSISSMDAKRSGRQIYCVVTDKYGNSVRSETVTLTAVEPLRISAQTGAVYVLPGEEASFHAGAVGGIGPYAYQWQYSANVFSGYRDITSTHTWARGYDTETLQFVAAVTDLTQQNKYRCKITDATGACVYSDPIPIVEPLRITAQSEKYDTIPGDPVLLQVTAAGGRGEYTYQWQYADDLSNRSWQNISADSGNTLCFPAKASDFDQHRRYRCIVTDAYGDEVVSNPIQLAERLNLRAQDTVIHADTGEMVSVRVAAFGGTGPYVYRWYLLADGMEPYRITTLDSSWAAGYDTNTLTFMVTAEDLTRYRYLCTVTDRHGNTVSSSPIAIAPRP